MQSPLPMLAMCAGYYVLCMVGPLLMRNRKPFEMTVAMVIYNITMVVLSFYLFVEVTPINKNSYVARIVLYITVEHT